MGLFDGKIIELGTKLSTNLVTRASELYKKAEESKDNPGAAYGLKIQAIALEEVANIILKSVKED